MPKLPKGIGWWGGDVSFSYTKSETESVGDFQNFSLNISPNAGHFFWNKLALGIRTDYTFSTTWDDRSSNSESNRLAVSPFLRYYFLDVEKIYNVFAESSYNFETFFGDYDGKEFSLKAGLAIFLNQSVAFEISLNYLNLDAENQNGFIGRNTLLLGFGIQVHLEKNKIFKK